MLGMKFSVQVKPTFRTRASSADHRNTLDEIRIVETDVLRVEHLYPESALARHQVLRSAVCIDPQEGIVDDVEREQRLLAEPEEDAN